MEGLSKQGVKQRQHTHTHTNCHTRKHTQPLADSINEATQTNTLTEDGTVMGYRCCYSWLIVAYSVL